MRRLTGRPGGAWSLAAGRARLLPRSAPWVHELAGDAGEPTKNRARAATGASDGWRAFDVSTAIAEVAEKRVTRVSCCFTCPADTIARSQVEKGAVKGENARRAIQSAQAFRNIDRLRDAQD